MCQPSTEIGSRRQVPLQDQGRSTGLHHSLSPPGSKQEQPHPGTIVALFKHPMVVDDEADIVEVVSYHLLFAKTLGVIRHSRCILPVLWYATTQCLGNQYAPWCAHTLTSGVEAATRGSFDVILLDIYLPGGNIMEAGRLSGLFRTRLYQLIKKYGQDSLP